MRLTASNTGVKKARLRNVNTAT